jgi:hypothetical protein
MARKDFSNGQSSERHKKPQLTRSEPIRSWSTLFGTTRNGSTNGHAAPSASVKRGVELGYSVIDDYIKQGMDLANAFANPKRAHATSPQDLPKMAERLVQYGSDFASMWFDAMTLMLSNLNGASTGAPTAAPSPKASSSVAFDLGLLAQRPTTVRLTLTEPLAAGPLLVADLRSPSSTKVIRKATIEVPEDGRKAIKVNVQVPAQIPPGSYSGTIFEKATKSPRGRLMVIVAK